MIRKGLAADDYEVCSPNMMVVILKSSGNDRHCGFKIIDYFGLCRVNMLPTSVRRSRLVWAAYVAYGISTRVRP